MGTRMCGRSAGGADQRCATLAEWIARAASEVAGRITALNYGKPIASLGDLLACCERLGIVVVGISRERSFHAVLFGGAGDSWTILYNTNSSAARQARYVAHELAEYITREQTWGDEPPEHLFSDHDAVRHAIAQAVEELCVPHPRRGSAIGHLAAPLSG